MRNTSIIEAARYSTQLLPLKCEVYKNGSSSYSNFKMLSLSKEVAIPRVEALKTGMLPEIQAFWYLTQNNLSYTLNIFRYDLDSLETIPNFTSSICFVKIFKSTRGIFNQKIHHCMLVVTETEIIIYGIENETHSIINTDFSAKLYSKAQCLDIVDGNIFIGCQDGNVYHAMCKSIDFLNYRYLNLVSSGNSVLRSITAMFTKKKERISSISAGGKYLVSLSKNIEVFNVTGGIYKMYEIPVDVSYVHVQIVEENPLLFYCVQSTGLRDFFTTEKLFTKDPPVVENSDVTRTVHTTPVRFLTVRSEAERSSLIFVSFNEDQLRNFSRSKPVENYELQTHYTDITDVLMTDSSLVLLTPASIIHYTILDTKMFLMNCRTQETYLMYKNYGDVEFMVKYFQLLTENEDVSKLDGLCKNESIRNHALFVWIYTLISPVWTIDLKALKSTQNSEETSLITESELDGIIKRLRVLRQGLGFGYNTAKDFIDEFIQTSFFTSLLSDYSIDFKETFESILTRDSDFKTYALKGLLDAFTLNQSIEPLLKTMQNSCPMYLPLEHINMQRGLQLIKKDDRDSLMRSLSYLSQARFDTGVVNKFNSLGFFYGSVYLIREKFDFDYETAIILLKESVRCRRAFLHGLEDIRESFLFPFFEAILELDVFSPCICCDTAASAPDLMSISNPLFKIFLADRIYKNEKACDTYWKYLVMKNEKVEAVQTLLNLSQRADFSLQKKVEFLQTALSISTGTHLNSEARLRLKLYEIQKELMGRPNSPKTSLLLDSETLYNDYCCDHADLKIRVLDVINYKDEAKLRDLYECLFRDLPLRDCLLFLRDLTNKKLSLVFDLLIKKIRSPTLDFCTSLLNSGFDYDEILASVKNSLNSNVDPAIKVELLKSLKIFSRHGEYQECEKSCEKNFGIRVYK